MILCPRCGQPGIRPWRYANAGRWVPARCGNCDAKVLPPLWAMLGMGLLLQLAFLAAAVAAFVYWSWWPVLGLAVAWLLLALCVSRFTRPRLLVDA
jgi:hypothetical protein